MVYLEYFHNNKVVEKSELDFSARTFLGPGSTLPGIHMLLLVGINELPAKGVSILKMLWIKIKVGLCNGVSYKP
jgi:hypothetical protein